VGYRDVTGTLDACIAIRTLIERGGVVHVQAGAGIVFDSIPSSELIECRNKASALVHAVAMAEAAARRDRGGS
jgi:anthranilate synthase component 1